MRSGLSSRSSTGLAVIDFIVGTAAGISSSPLKSFSSFLSMKEVATVETGRYQICYSFYCQDSRCLCLDSS